MQKHRNPASPSRPAPTDIGTFASGGVPVRRNLISVARRLFQICTTAAAETLAAENLTTLQFGAIVYLSRATGQPDIDQSALAARLAIDRASMSQIVEELVAMGLVERRINGADRRARLLSLTPRGEKLRARLHPAQIAGQWRILETLAPRERDLLLDLLVRVVATNSTLARPGSGRRKRGSRQMPDSKSHPSSSNKNGRMPSSSSA